MSNIIIRPVQTADEEGYWQCLSLTYNDGKPFDQESMDLQRMEREQFVVRYGEEVVAAFNVIPGVISRGTSRLGCGGVAAVCVMPELRHAGVGSKMMEWYIRYAHENEVPIAALYPFSERYYRQFGYEVCGKRLKIKCPVRNIPKGLQSLPIRRLKPEDFRLLDPCLRVFAEARAGVFIRDEVLWNRVTKENRELVIYAAGDPVEAYAVVSHETSFYVNQHISDFLWATSTGYESMLGFFRQLGINKESISWYEPSDSPYFARFYERGVSVELDRPIMYRVTDIANAFHHLHPMESGEFSLAVVDSIMPENEGPWHVRFTAGEKVELLPAEQGAIKMTIQQFSQAYMGEPSMAELVRMGVIESNSKDATEAMIKLLPKTSVYCPDFF